MNVVKFETLGYGQKFKKVVKGVAQDQVWTVNGGRSAYDAATKEELKTSSSLKVVRVD
jgi:hypothetical protein